MASLLKSTQDVSSSGSKSQPKSSFSFSNPSNFNFPDKDPELVEPAEKYKCPIHLGILRNPVQTACGHRLCRECLENYLGDETSKPCPVPDEEVQEVSRDTIHPDSGFRREIKQLLVYCALKTRGCPAKIKLRDYSNHVQECEYRPVDCQYKLRGCTEDVAWKARSNHEKKCDYRPLSCRLCGQEFNAKDTKITLMLLDQSPNKRHLKDEFVPDPNSSSFHRPQIADANVASGRPLFEAHAVLDDDTLFFKDHETNHCPEANVDCPYKCGKAKLKRRELDDHKAVCPLKPTDDFTGDKSAVENDKKNASKYFDYMTSFLYDWAIKRKKETEQTVQGDKSAVENDKKNASKYFDYMTSVLYDLEIKWKKETEQTVQREAEHLKKFVETNIKNISKDFKLKLLQLEKRTDEMAQALTDTQEQNVLLQQNLDQLKNTGGQRQDNPQLSGVKLRPGTMDMRFQMIETANYDGTLLWKIRDYSIRRRDAVQGRTVSLYSQPFYSSRFGYKMCAKVFLNGDGIGKGTHLSLYFVVMKGEYDALLQWPFGLKITLMLLDQSPNKRHLKDEFMPDPNSTSFCRPQSADMNIACGCPLFVAHAVLDDAHNQYVKDDTLFFKVSVDCSQLPRI